MSLLIGFLTFILVVDSLLLMLLVLVQLPKKEAGAGLAFGAGAVDTLIGAGSGNALTKMTKYAAGIFLGLAVVLAILNAQSQNRSVLRDELLRSSSPAPMMPQQPATTPASGTLNTVPAANPAATTVPANTTPAAGTTAPAQQTQPGVNLNPVPVPQTPAATPANNTPANTTPAQNTPPAGSTPQP